MDAKDLVLTLLAAEAKREAHSLAQVIFLLAKENIQILLQKLLLELNSKRTFIVRTKRSITLDKVSNYKDSDCEIG